MEQKLIPWRKPDERRVLHLALMKVAFLEKPYLKSNHLKGNLEWDNFADEVFKQDEFNGFKECSATNIREQFNDCMDEILKQIESGGNLSGKEGDLEELEKLVRDINKEKQEEIDQVLVDRDKAVVLARDLHSIEEIVVASSISGIAAPRSAGISSYSIQA